MGSGCRDATRYELALKDAREVFDIGNEMGFAMNILDIGGGFPGETHSMWNPAEEIVSEDREGQTMESDDGEKKTAPEALTFFTNIAETVGPLVDELFPSPDIRVIAEPGKSTFTYLKLLTRLNKVGISARPLLRSAVASLQFVPIMLMKVSTPNLLMILKQLSG